MAMSRFAAASSVTLVLASQWSAPGCFLPAAGSLGRPRISAGGASSTSREEDASQSNYASVRSLAPAAVAAGVLAVTTSRCPRKASSSAATEETKLQTMGTVWGYGTDFGPWPGLEGATMPLVDPTSGMDRWDPMRLSAGDSEKFDRYRRAEVKHGRVAMLAVTGLVAQHAFRLPYIITGDEGSPIASLASVPSGFNAISTWPASVGFGLLFLLAGFVEMAVWSDNGRAPGDFGDPASLGSRPISDKKGARRVETFSWTDDKGARCIELEHGRLAMMGFIGALAAEYVTGYDSVDQWAHVGEAFKK